MDRFRWIFATFVGIRLMLKSEECKIMALAINIEDLLNKQKIESNRIEFKKGWNPGSIYRSICAFANDFDDLGSEKSSEIIMVGSEKTVNSSEKILAQIKQKPTISAVEIAMQIEMSSRGVEKQIRKLREKGIIKRIGADRGGYWEIIKDDNN